MVDKREKLAVLLKIRAIYLSDFGGLLKNGRIVDRREFPQAMPIGEYAKFGVPKPENYRYLT
ncbi:hypothetical protein SRABI27_04798 [Pedobacter sp. Bi27]|uniref:hypothetical protein n=1 Tax=Pedobacter sp. Bi27 TaxID=2822351 RepID=UPI001D562634|nr:hypothetical protein [Pedobacter sp. Bi27]CAH0311425.1 hypothetical protein SRABI27_04798 [Pedobacter sp. Bi27]